MNLAELEEIRQGLIRALRMGGYGPRMQRKRIEETVRWARLLPPGNLTSGEYRDLDWHFCETLADRIREDHPDEAGRLYELAGESFTADGHLATGSGEGLRSVADRERVQEKARNLSPPGKKRRFWPW